MNQAKKPRLLECVRPVGTWNPNRSADAEEFNYIDIGAIDQARKAIGCMRAIRCAEAPSRARQLVAAGDILVSTVRPNLNAVAKLGLEHDGATASTGFCVIRPDPAKLDGAYAFQWVKSPGFVNEMVSLATGASYPAVSDRIVLGSCIPLPPLTEQRRIAAILDQSDALRSQRQQALAELDALSRAVFVEMFGEFRVGSTRWPNRPLGELMTDSTIGLVRAADEFGPDFDVPYVRMNAIGRGGAFLPDLVQRTNVDLDEQRRFALKPGDLLFNTRNSRELVGKTALFRERGLYVFNNNVMRIRFNEAVHSEYIAAAFQTPFIQQELETRKAGTTSVFAIYARELKTIPMPIPPRVTQDAFAERIQAIESIKAIHRSALAESDALFASLQHRAFTGAL